MIGCLHAIADYSAVIDIPDVWNKHMAEALIRRGKTYQEITPPQTDKAIADYSAVIGMPDAPADLKAIAMSNRRDIGV